MEAMNRFFVGARSSGVGRCVVVSKSRRWPSQLCARDDTAGGFEVEPALRRCHLRLLVSRQRDESDGE